MELLAAAHVDEAKGAMIHELRRRFPEIQLTRGASASVITLGACLSPRPQRAFPRGPGSPAPTSAATSSTRTGVSPTRYRLVATATTNTVRGHVPARR